MENHKTTKSLTTMDFRINKQASIQFLIMGLFLIALGVFLTWPLQIDLKAIEVLLSPLATTWWKIALFLMCGWFIAFAQVKQGRYVIAEYLGTISCLTLFYPFMGFLAGLPEGIGIKALLFVLGGLITMTSLSALMAICLLHTFQNTVMATNR